MFCPRDSAQLDDLESKSMAFHCKVCAGTLVQNESLAGKIANEGILTEKIRPYSCPMILCPGCKGGMVNITLNGVDVDLCGKCHSVWFDKDEVSKIQERLSPEEIQRLYLKNQEISPIDLIDLITDSRPDWFP